MDFFERLARSDQEMYLNTKTGVSVQSLRERIKETEINTDGKNKMEITKFGSKLEKNPMVFAKFLTGANDLIDENQEKKQRFYKIKNPPEEDVYFKIGDGNGLFISKLGKVVIDFGSDAKVVLSTVKNWTLLASGKSALVKNTHIYNAEIIHILKNLSVETEFEESDFD